MQSIVQYHQIVAAIVAKIFLLATPVGWDIWSLDAILINLKKI